MTTRADLRILFPTSFSDACFRTIRSVAQLADSCSVELTIAHNVPNHIALGTTARHELDSFFAEADHYTHCRRVLLRGDALGTISDLAHSGDFDMVMIPASDRIGLPKLFRSSFRARLLQRCEIPVWTCGNALDTVQVRRQIRTLTCLVDFRDKRLPHVKLASSLAKRIGARLHVVHMLEAVDEGTLARFCYGEPPLCEELAKRDIQANCAENADVNVVVGTRGQELARLLKSFECDLLFVGPGQALGSCLFGARLQKQINGLPCPVVCVDGAAGQFTSWSFDRAEAEQCAAAAHYGRMAIAV